jgi:hypothetical protein
MTNTVWTAVGPSTGGGSGSSSISNAVIALTPYDASLTNFCIDLASITNFANIGYTLTLTTSIWLTVTNPTAAIGMPFTIDFFQSIPGTNNVVAAVTNWWTPSAAYLNVTTNSQSWTKWSCQVNPYGTNVMFISSLNITNH